MPRTIGAEMPVPLVNTKLSLPQKRQGLVARPRLDDLLDADGARLTLLSAPAGFGKTTLLTTWLSDQAATATRPSRVAWVSLDEADRSADSFWAYVLSSLDRAAPGTASAALAMLEGGQAPVEVVLATVLNELSVLPDDVVLVLDDYHLAEGPEVQTGMTFLVDRLPPQVRLIISTRADPALPLARLRARGELAEVRAADLRFTETEATAYLTDATGLRLEPSDVAALEARTEGWIASLQLAALSLRGREDPAEFIAGFAGDDRYVVDYLVEEVLDRQPADVRGFLLATSILDRLTGSLCDALTATSGGARMLAWLERRNLFVVPLDDQRRWYRYHHLFADVLRAHALAEQPDRLPELHRRASGWYADAGDPAPAVRHALAAGDVDRAAELVELAIPEMRRERRDAVIRGWVDALPDDVLRNRPVLAIGLVGGLMASNELDGIEQRLQEIERQLDLPSDQLVVADLQELRRVPAAVEMYRAALSLLSGDPAGTIAHAGKAMDRAGEADHLERAAASALSGLASWTSGDLDAAQRGYTAAARGLERAGHIADVLGCSITLADLAVTKGRLREAQETLEGALRLAEDQDPAMRGIADMHVGLSELAIERNDLVAAGEHLRRAGELGDPAGLPQNPYRSRVALARLRAATGDLDSAHNLLEEARSVYDGDYSPDVRPVRARLARVKLAQGDLAGAWEWAHRRDLTATDDLSYLHEYEHVTLARILLAEHRAQKDEAALRDATALLDRLQRAAEAGGRTGTVVEVGTLRALALHARGNRAGAIATLEQMLRIAEPEGYVRVFLGEAGPLAELLDAVVTGHPEWAYPRDLADAARPGAAPTPQTSPDHLVDPLSDRELEVLRLLATDLDGPGVARRLFVSLNTVRTHTKHIYTKLGVNSRRSAVSRAHQLGLLAQPRSG